MTAYDEYDLEDLDEEVPRPEVPAWPLALLALPAFVAIWSGWVGLGSKTGFGVVHPLPGIWDSLTIDTAITLPIGMETYAAYALWVWLARGISRRTLEFARASAIGALAIGALGQITYHLLDANGVAVAHWLIIALVSCLPVAVLGMSAYLVHLIRCDQSDADAEERRRRRERHRRRVETPATPAATPAPVPLWNGYASPPRHDTSTLADRVRDADRVSTETDTSTTRGNGSVTTSTATPRDTVTPATPSIETPSAGSSNGETRKTDATRSKTKTRGAARRRETDVERRREYVRDRLRAGHDVTGPEVKEQFPHESNPARLIRHVRNELAWGVDT